MRCAISFCDLRSPSLAAILSLTLLLSPAAGVEESEGTASPPDDSTVLHGPEAMRVAIRMARVAMNEGDFQESLTILGVVISHPQFPSLPDDDRVAGLYALGQTYNGLGRHADAVRVYRRILADFPGLVRVRLELARSLFFLQDDAVADYHFRMALAGDLPPNVRENVHQYLNAIRTRRRWTVDFRASAVGNDNVNLAPTIRQIEMGPIVFDLDRDFRARSGFGISTQLFAEYRPQLEENILARFGGFAEHTHYTNSDFNDTILGGYVGPHFILPNRSTLSLLTSGYRRWFGGHPLNQSLGPAVEYSFEPTQRLRVATRLEHAFVRYDTLTDYSGTLTSFLARPVYALTPSSFGTMTLGVAYDRPNADLLQNWQYRFGLGYHRDFAGGFTIGVQPEYRYIRYEERFPAFQFVRRTDHIWSVRTDLLNRRLDWYGFTPVLGYHYQNRSSSIPLYDFDQHRIDLSLTRRF